MLKRMAICFSTICMMFALTGQTLMAGDLIKLKIGHQGTLESYPTYRAIARGLDEKAGLDLEMVYFDSGADAIEALPSKAWDVAGVGGVPMLMGALRYQAYLAAATTDDGLNNMVMVRGDSPILSVKGTNPEYPNVYGSVELVKGKTVLVPTVTSAHYVLTGWLRALGLSEKDVVVQNMDVAQAVAAYDSGVGDVISVWAPPSVTGLSKGWKCVGDGNTTAATLPLVFAVSKDTGDKHPEAIAKFLKVYFDVVAEMNNELKNDREALIKDVGAYFIDWGGLKMEPEIVGQNLDIYPMYDMAQNIALYKSEGGKSKMEKLFMGGVNFFYDNKKFTDNDKEQLEKTPFITDKFIELATQIK
jgi:NitT/TauT family transport system substrate-binding protein/sulfonate transport system substrate-binding protein